MTSGLKISFIVPVYNADKYIEKCVTSIVNQSYKDIEVIFVNDGSTDASENKIQKFIDKHSNMRLINQENGGPSKARNQGIRAATGYYISFVDVDDCIDKDFALKMVKASRNGKCDLVISNYIEENKLGTINVDIFKEYGSEIELGFDTCMKETLRGPGGLVWGKLFKRSIIEEHCIQFDENHKMCEDLLFAVDFTTHIEKSSKCNECLYLHNKCNENSITANYKLEMLYKQIDIQKVLKGKLVERNIWNNDNAEILNYRFKDILQYSLDKVCNEKSISYSNKIKKIEDIFLNEDIKYNISIMNGNGLLDKRLVSAIKREKPYLVYFFIKVREIIVDLYSKIRR